MPSACSIHPPAAPGRQDATVPPQRCRRASRLSPARACTGTSGERCKPGTWHRRSCLSGSTAKLAPASNSGPGQPPHIPCRASCQLEGSCNTARPSPSPSPLRAMPVPVCPTGGPAEPATRPRPGLQVGSKPTAQTGRHPRAAMSCSTRPLQARRELGPISAAPRHRIHARAAMVRCSPRHSPAPPSLPARANQQAAGLLTH